jgi:hypothetical protein
VALFVTMLALLQASRCFVADSVRMRAGMAEPLPA